MIEVMVVCVGIASLIISIGVPAGLYLLNAFRGDIIRLHSRIDDHISNYSIHQKKEGE